MKINYKLSDTKYDLKSGLAVAALSLPIAVAYSEMIGLPPESGIFTVVFSLICYFIFGSSKDLIMGPDSATIALIAASIFAVGGLSDEINSRFI
ncbi:MAG TPA: sodium-independent anion transporter, partial [Bacteroidetes bacterium]|nr:sodium-independent anion transporter [Bacteroidota bacterium]